MAQAEVWLRVALNRFPRDPNILGLAARFEQARGNNKRASEFWRAALAASPSGSNLDSGLAYPVGSSRAPGPGDIKRLLDPRLDAQPSPEQIAPLPSYKPESSAEPSAAEPFPSSASTQATAPSANPLPLPFEPTNSGYGSEEQGTMPPSPPVFVPENAGPRANPSAPVFVPPTAASPVPNAAPPPELTGRVRLPPSEENIESTGPDEAEIPALPQPSSTEQNSAPPANLRISSEPMNALAAQAEARLAQQTDSQLTQGSASLIHTLPNAPVASAPTVKPALPGQGTYDTAQYTPSAQDAASGAFSAPRQSPTAPPACAPAGIPACPSAKPSAKPSAGSTAARRRRRRRPVQHANQPPVPTLGNAPIAGAAPESTAIEGQSTPPGSQEPAEAPEQNPSVTTTGTGLSDQELEQRNLPPLRGPWIRIQRQANPPSPRELAEEQLQAIESGYSGWLGGTSLVNYRSGSPGYSQLAAIESPFEASAPLGYHARITAIAKPVFLDSGQANGTANISVQEFESGASCLVTIPEPIGTDAASQNFTPCTSPSLGALTPPAQQNAFGLGGELQLTFPHLSLAGGYTPFNFLVSTFTGRFQWQPGGGPVTLSFVRDSEKDSQLSYAGLRDPGQASLSYPGQIWGGVVANQGLVQFARGDAESGFYFAAGGQYLTGYNVEKNNREDGTGGAYWRTFASPEYGNLTIGANFFAMHYANNQNAFTHGMGGYFSPQAYFLGNVPFSWIGHYRRAGTTTSWARWASRRFRKIRRRSGLWPATSLLKPARTIPCCPVSPASAPITIFIARRLIRSVRTGSPARIWPPTIRATTPLHRSDSLCASCSASSPPPPRLPRVFSRPTVRAPSPCRKPEVPQSRSPTIPKFK